MLNTRKTHHGETGGGVQGDLRARIAGEETLSRVGPQAYEACIPQFTGASVPCATDQVLFAQEEDAACRWPALLDVFDIISKEPARHTGECEQICTPQFD